ncbi:uncharacterized protein LOC129894699 [Solanum dulcamara]|uniref:uncharacterized protein LOC129894699 n=1 Tax=Solanum dulcamara TaxID=45834 RepID=UPI002484DB16|nr:uncharacterized protein LOC129894699 [Solanum dulcamara]
MEAKQVTEQLQQARSKRGNMVRQTYLHIIGEQPRLQWKCLLFKNVARPKAYFIMWLMLQKRLMTTDRLTKWGMKVSKKCVLCQMTDEIIEHLFVQCQFSICLWNRLLAWSHNHDPIPANWDQFLKWCIRHGKVKVVATQIFKIILAKCVYAIWIERNNRVFQKKSSSVEYMAKEIAYITIVRAKSTLRNVLNSFIF